MSAPPWPPPPPRPLGVPAAAPARRPTSRSWQIGLLVLALVGSLGLAWGVRPESTTPDVRASRFVGGAGTNTVLGSGEQSMVVETSHYSGATYLVDSIGAHAVAVVSLGVERAKKTTFVTETYLQAEKANPYTFTLGADGLKLLAMGEGKGAARFSPALTELPANAAPGMSWHESVELFPGFDEQGLPFERRSEIKASPVGPDCLLVVHRERFNEKDFTSEITRCPGRGVVGHGSRTASEGRPSWGSSPSLQLGTPRYTSVTHRDVATLNPPLTYQPAVAGRPVALGDGVALTNNSSAAIDFMVKTEQGYQLAWRRRPGRRVLSLLGAGDVLVAATSDRKLVAYDPQGRLLWQVETDDTTTQALHRLDDKTFAFLAQDGWLSAYDLATGARRWRRATPDDGSVPMATAHLGGRPVVAVVGGSEVWVLDPTQRLLRLPMIEAVRALLPTSDGLLIAAASSTMLVNWNGRVQWHTSRVQDCEEFARLERSAAGPEVICRSDTSVSSFRLTTGQLLWQEDVSTLAMVSDGARAVAISRDTAYLLGGGIEQRSLMAFPSGDVWLVPLRSGLLAMNYAGKTVEWTRR